MTRTHRRLLALNLALAGALAIVALAPITHAQRSGRVRGDYTMVAGRVQGSPAHAVYLIDGVNQDAIALRWNESRRSLESLGYRDIRADALAQPGR